MIAMGTQETRSCGGEPTPTTKPWQHLLPQWHDTEARLGWCERNIGPCGYRVGGHGCVQVDVNDHGPWCSCILEALMNGADAEKALVFNLGEEG